MSSYISSKANRFYVAAESSFGKAAPITEANRIIASKLSAHQTAPTARRRDKTGSRTNSTVALTGPLKTAYEVQTYLTGGLGVGESFNGELMQAGLGGTVETASGLIVAAVPSASTVQTASAHGLRVGSGVAYGQEIRFVTSVPNPTELGLNAPFSTRPPTGVTLDTTTTYRTGTSLPSLTIYDYWDPADAVDRILVGATVNEILIHVAGPTHTVSFGGPASDLIDSESFASGMGGLQIFPVEPSLSGFDYSDVSGQLGEVWLGSQPEQFFTLTSAQVQVNNNLQMRQTDVGPVQPRAAVPGVRQVMATFNLLAQDDTQTAALYAIARQRGTMAVMLQMGTQAGARMAVYLPAVTPEIPLFDDNGELLVWNFTNSVARGVSDDELVVAFS